MRFQPQQYSLCANTAFLDRHLNNAENLEQQMDDTYTSIVNLFLDQLIPTATQEDLHSDLSFEIECHIDRYGYNIDAEDVETLIYKEFKIKEAD